MTDQLEFYHYDDDDLVDVFYKDTLIHSITYDRYGWDGMAGVQEALANFAELAGIGIVVTHREQEEED